MELNKNSYKTIAIIPARGGSKGIIRKNLSLICNQPLIGYSIKAAIKSKLIDRVIVSSDDEEIIQVAKSFGAEVPFKRPDEISSDQTAMIDVLKHMVSYLVDNNESIEAIVLLQPTSPLRTEKHIDEAISQFRSSKASSVVSVIEVPHQFNPYSVLSLNQNGELRPIKDKTFTRRQDKPKFYARNGPAILVVSPSLILDNELYGQTSLPYFMTIEDSLDIDKKEDLEEAFRILNNRKNII